MFLVALAGLAANGFGILILRKSIKNDLNVKGAFLHMFADIASSVFIIIGAIVVSLTGWYIIDPLLGIGISVLIFTWAFGLMRDSINVLMETSPKGINANIVTEEIKKIIPEITAINDMHIWEITSGMYSLTAHVEATMHSSSDVSEIIQRINKILNDKFGIDHTTIQIEPKNPEFL